MTEEQPPKREYVTTRDIHIRSGTPVHIVEPKTTTHGSELISIVISEGKGVTSEWFMYLDDAFKIGLIR